MAIYDVTGNVISADVSSVLCFRRDYSYINPLLQCEAKDLNNDGTLSNSTTRCVIHLPKNGTVEVKQQKNSGMFKVAKVYGSSVTWIDSVWSYYTTRYMGDASSDYYAIVAKTSAGTESISTAEALDFIAVYQFFDVGEKKNISSLLNGKTIAAIGDSITQGRFRKFAAEGLTWTATKPFAGLVAETACDFNYGNFGIGGAKVSGNSWDSVLTNCGKVNGYDVVFICGGTNDFGGSVQLETFSAAYQTVIDTLKANNAEVVACTPVFRTYNAGPNSRGLTLPDYCNTIKTVASSKGIKCIDLYTLTNDGVFITYCPDGLHPNEVGHKIIADLIVQQYEMLSA